ncbi:MAG: DUF3772 domain-containing protein [Hyphomicrobiales bacterium]|nr:DUF3772 domain-containing protein [Hyphomicrobiales bacterium]
MAHHFFMADKTGAGQTGAGFYSVMMRSLLMVCLLLGLPALALAQSALGASEGGTGVNLAAVKAQVEGLKLELNQIEAGLERRALSTEVLVVQRQRLDDIGIQLRKFGEELNPRAELLRSRIKELGPEPDSKAPPESPEIAKDRADRDRALKEVDELIKITRSAALQASQLVDLVVEKRREAFQAHLFERTSSLLAPGLWVDVVMGLPKDMSAFVILSTNTLGRIIDVRGLLGLALLMAGLASLVVITWLTLDVTHKIAAARFPDTNPSPFRKSLRAVFYALTGFALPTLAGFVMLEIFTSLGMVPPRLETIVLPFVRGLAFIGFARGLVVGLTAVKHPVWSLINLSPRLVGDLRTLVLMTMSLLVAGQVVEAVIQTIAAGLPLTVATRGSFAVLIAVVMMRGLQHLAAGHVAVEEDWCSRMAGSDPSGRMAQSGPVGAGCVFRLCRIVGLCGRAIDPRIGSAGALCTGWPLGGGGYHGPFATGLAHLDLDGNHGGPAATLAQPVGCSGLRPVAIADSGYGTDDRTGAVGHPVGGCVVVLAGSSVRADHRRCHLVDCHCCGGADLVCAGDCDDAGRAALDETALFAADAA